MICLALSLLCSSHTFQAYVTRYTCDTTPCINAVGHVPKVGTVACPRSIPLKSKMLLKGKTYVCEDRYAKWLDIKRDMPTVDIFVENESEAIGLDKETIDYESNQ